MLLSTDLIEGDIAEIKKNYPQSRVVDDGKSGKWKKVFILEQNYSKQFDNAKFYAIFAPACFIQADIYNGDKYEYSINTSTGKWKEHFETLKAVVDNASKKGSGIVGKEATNVYLGINYTKIE